MGESNRLFIDTHQLKGTIEGRTGVIGHIDGHMEKRCISAYVENQIGVLAKISGLFAGKNYNLDTLTVGETEDPTMSRMTIELTCDDLTYEQIIKQLNRSVEVIKVIIDYQQVKGLSNAEDFLFICFFATVDLNKQ